jgi:hypothetical protein
MCDKSKFRFSIQIKNTLLPLIPEKSLKTSPYFKGDRYRQKYELKGNGGNTRTNTLENLYLKTELKK